MEVLRSQREEWVRQYYLDRIKTCRNPAHIKFYKERLKAGEKKVAAIKVYSEKLKMTFDSARDASRYIGKSDAYVSRVLNGDYKKNIYGFKKI